MIFVSIPLKYKPSNPYGKQRRQSCQQQFRPCRVLSPALLTLH